jgi:hypothetical protein
MGSERSTTKESYVDGGSGDFNGGSRYATSYRELDAMMRGKCEHRGQLTPNLVLYFAAKKPKEDAERARSTPCLPYQSQLAMRGI